MRLNRSTALLVALMLVVVLAPACKKKSKDVETIPAPPPTSVPAEPRPDPARSGDTTGDFPTEEPTVADVDLDAAAVNKSGVLRPVYFDYDQSELRPEARETLQANADWIRDHPKFRIIIEGHCDERGSIEYNLALGDRRANSAREYVATLGLPTSRIRVVSYGEERPANPGHTDAAWSLNRRAEFLVE